jgi:hypothetical protein
VPKNKEKQYALETPFVVDSIEIDKKDVLNYIKGKSHPIIGDDFYYSYIYKDKILSFISFASKKHITGNYLPVIAPALLQEGKYFYNPLKSNVYYFFENSSGVIKTEIGYEEKDGYENVLTIQLPKDIPDTLKMRWSLQSQINKLYLLGMTTFILSVVFFFVNNSIHGKEPEPIDVKPVIAESIKESMPDITGIIENIGQEVMNKGHIEKAQLQPDGLQFVIRFRNESYAHSFISRYGGKYEGGAVIYTSSLDNK